MPFNFDSTLVFLRPESWDPAILLSLGLRAYFLLTSAAVVLVRVIPPLRQSFIPYGKTLAGRQQPPSLLPWISNITVSKNWFWHYYLLSVLLSLFWGYQAFLHPSIVPFGCRSLTRVDGRTVIVWSLMLAQGCRRLYESLFVQKKSTARMWIGHYLVGCAFYIAMSMAVFVDGEQRPLGICCL